MQNDNLYSFCGRYKGEIGYGNFSDLINEETIEKEKQVICKNCVKCWRARKKFWDKVSVCQGR
jgi:hypothetical protein